MNEIDVVLSSLGFLSAREKLLLSKNLDSLSALAVLSTSGIEEIIGRGLRVRGFSMKNAVYACMPAFKVIEAKGIGSVRFDDESFPPLLREIADVPYVLYYRGNIGVLSKPCVSVVGTRNACPECARAAAAFSRDAAMDGYTVVSGLAKGIDSYAHKGSLSCAGEGFSGAACAVLPCGIDTVVPSVNRALASAILKTDGLLLSECPPGTFVQAFRFVQRNRIIAGLSEAVLVVQSPCSGGALITADFALDFNRDLLFHSSCFCEEALKIERKSVLMEESASRRERVPSAYVRDGALVINDYADFLNAVERQRTDLKMQPELFDGL